MQRIDTANNVASQPTPLAQVNAPGYFANAAGGGDGTIVSGDFLNQVQEEILTPIVEAGLTPSKSDNTQLWQALQRLISPPGAQVQLQYVSPTALALMPLNGNTIRVAGKVYGIPAGGLAIPNTSLDVGGTPGANLAVSTLYHVYVKDNGSGVLIPSLYTGDSHAPDTTAGNIGVEIKSGDATRTLVGMVQTDGAAHFADFLTLSWFNRRKKVQRTGFTTNRSTGSTTMVELNAEIRNSFLCWAGQSIDWRFNGMAGGGNSQVFVGASFDGGSIEPAVGSYYGYGESLGLGDLKTGLGEGLHYLTVCGAVDAGTLTLYSGAPAYGGTGHTPTQVSVIVEG